MQKSSVSTSASCKERRRFRVHSCVFFGVIFRLFPNQHMIYPSVQCPVLKRHTKVLYSPSPAVLSTEADRHNWCSIKFFLSHSLLFPPSAVRGIWSLSGKVSVRANTTLPVCIIVQLVHCWGGASSVRQIDDRHPLVHAAALSAKSVDFAQCRVFPWSWMWALKQKRENKWTSGQWFINKSDFPVFKFH